MRRLTLWSCVVLISLGLVASPVAAQVNIAIGDEVRVEMQLGARDGWMFEGQAGQIIDIVMTARSFDTLLELYRPDGRMLLANDERPDDTRTGVGYESEIGPVQLPDTGVYTIVATGRAISSQREYTLSISEADTPIYTEIVPEQVISGVLEGRQVIHWVFSGIAGQDATLTIQTDVSAFNLGIGVTMQTGSVYISNLGFVFEGQGDVFGPVVLPYTGSYTMDLISHSDAAGSYDVELILGEPPVQNTDDVPLLDNCIPPETMPEIDGFSHAQDAPPDESALEALDSALLTVPDSALYLQRARLYLQLDNYEQALADAGHAFEMNPDQAEVYQVLGEIYALMGSHRQALLNFDEALQRLPDQAALYNDRGYVYFLKGEYVAAVLDFNQALELAPVVLTLSNRATTYFTMGLCPLADEDFQSVVDLAAGITPSSDLIPADIPTPNVVIGLPVCSIKVSNPIDAHQLPSLDSPVLFTLAPSPYAPIGQILQDGLIWWELSGGAWLPSDQVEAVGACDELPVIEVEAPAPGAVAPVDSCIVRVPVNVSLYETPESGGTIVRTLTNEIGATATQQQTAADGTIWLYLVTNEWVYFDEAVQESPCEGLPMTSASPLEPTAQPTQDAAVSDAACNLRAASNANLRSGPGTSFGVQGTLTGGVSVSATGQAVGADGQVWWHLEDGAWVRSDIVTEDGNCESLPSVSAS